MNKTLIVIGIVVLVVLGPYLYNNKTHAPQSGAETMTQPQVVEQRPNTLRGLFALGESQKCTFTKVDGEQTVSGTIYLSEGRMRGDFTTGSPKTSFGSHMIADGRTMWVWQDTGDMGMTMDVTAPVGGATTDNSFEAPVALDDASVTYTCEPWNADEEYYVKPVGIVFHSMADMMQMGMPTTNPTDAGMGPGMEAGGGMMMDPGMMH